jgi:protoheme IX farnesyltransferase
VRPVLEFAAPFVVVIAGVAFVVGPWANRQAAEYRQRFEQREDVSLVSAGQFRESSSANRVFFVESISDDQTQVRNVFVTQFQDGKLTVVASSGGRITAQPNGDRFLVLEDGRRWDGTWGESAYRLMEFERYGVRLQAKSSELSNDSARLKSTYELIVDPTRGHLGELVWRIGLPLSAVVVALLAIPLAFVNPRTMWLTLATFVGYAVVYTIVLKPATPQNIVIGGASGAMPPLLGWAAVANDVGPQALVLFLIVFVWTPPHFWALALYRIEDYRRAGLPMLPVTHGPGITRLHILLYTVLLLATSMLPFMIRMSGWFYLASALVLGGVFVGYAWRLWRSYSDALAKRTFGYSIWYLAALFGAMLLDHWL